ncbi:MAG TPA: hypothetical protein VH678_18685 [Xanthobacteraceae bacterium]|jgi:uncharacterized protein (TIGR03066 family)
MCNIPGMTRLSPVALLLALALAGCSSDGAPVPETQYAAKIVGEWQGSVGDVKEAITFVSDGKFVSQVRQRGFISNTLGQGVTGTIRGTWTIQGKSITLKIDSAEDERVLNKQTMSTIEAFRPNQLVVKSDAGGTATFVRVL